MRLVDAGGFLISGGEGEIRTPVTRKGKPAFEAGAIDHSATSPRRRWRFQYIAFRFLAKTQSTAKNAKKTRNSFFASLRALRYFASLRGIASRAAPFFDIVVSKFFFTDRWHERKVSGEFTKRARAPLEAEKRSLPPRIYRRDGHRNRRGGDRILGKEGAGAAGHWDDPGRIPDNH